MALEYDMYLSPTINIVVYFYLCYKRSKVLVLSVIYLSIFLYAIIQFHIIFSKITVTYSLIIYFFNNTDLC